ncbi:dTDP-4-dehydrorhamnose reductase [Clostridium sp. 'White wine YQ']|uniref:dTDP-4-dehydrorhamnose reductase n=1 Tax=Clostridium sp. 'White wine YQ' TaxID=3027474 RepID=UPI0023651C2D|nr:dTDP-4-dehydrorhamnose reductase [Clostridium sp. 'White wine YQ']MDD7792743.1 dTDP-4-dehydrorhamnose reductase [Clostridium sp. 'White wine YQ']
MKILVTGSKGQLGKQIINILKNKRSEIGAISTEYDNLEIIQVDVEELDITDFISVKEYFGKVMPDVVINCAAYTNVDACESKEDLAFKINALGPRNLAIASNKFGAKLVHVSTDYVFNGEGTSPFKEYDMPNPVSVYGKTKLAGENFVREFADKYFIVRTAWLYGYEGNNFVYTIMKVGKEKGKLTVVNDQRGNPTNAEDLAHHLLKIAVTEEYGTYHCTGTGECSWYDFASKIIEFSEIECVVQPVTSEEYVRAAKRPSFSSLDNMMLRVTVGDEMRKWEDALKVFISKINK